MSKNNIVLGYYDSLLRSTDVELLEEKQWLNDNLIGFIYEYYEYEKYKDYNKDFLFVNPSIVQIIKFSTVEELHGMVEDWKKKNVVLVPINNNNDESIAGGTHWSLLVIYPQQHTSYHLDSAGQCNHHTAHLVSQKISKIFQATKDNKLIFSEKPSLQQSNAYDCGIHVISNTELVCDHYVNTKNNSSKEELNCAILTYKTEGKRSQIKQLIDKLSKSQSS